MLDIIEIAKEKGIEEGSLGADREMIPDLLFDRFGIVAVYIQEEIEKIKSLRVLKALQLHGAVNHFPPKQSQDHAGV